MEDEVHSEFGKGFIYNLLMFINHFGGDAAMFSELRHIHFVMQMSEEERAKVLVDNPDPKHNYGWNNQVKIWFESISPIHKTPEKAFSSWINLWVGTCQDHLHEIVCPDKYKETAIEVVLTRLTDKAHAMRSNYMEEPLLTWDDVMELRSLAIEIAVLVDKDLGVEIIPAQYS
jgi:hypothetical protein